MNLINTKVPIDFSLMLQQGGKFDLKALRKKYDTANTSQDNTKIASAHYVQPDKLNRDMFGRVVPQPQDNGSISVPYNKSVREKMLSGLNSLDRDGKSEVAKIVTEPLKSGLRLLRPDKYFENVHNDSDVGSALGSLGMDAVNAAPIVAGAARGVNFLRELTPSLEATNGILKAPVTKMISKGTSLGESSLPGVKKIVGTITDDGMHGWGTDEWNPGNETAGAGWVHTPNDAVKNDFINEVLNSHDVDPKIVEGFYDAHKQQVPFMHNKDRALIFKRNNIDAVRSGYKAGVPISRENWDTRFIEGNNIRTDYTPDEHLTTSLYTKGYDHYFNGRRPIQDPNLQASVDYFKDRLETLIKTNKVQKPTNVFRSNDDFVIPEVTGADGTVRKNVNFSELQKGDVYAPNSFTSTTLNHYGRGAFGKYQSEIALPGGGQQSVHYPNAMGSSEFRGEYEAILPKDLKYKVEHRMEPIPGSTSFKYPKFNMSIVNPYSLVGLIGGAGLVGAKK